jgi:hypothetical protein
METQNVTPDKDGRYAVMLGASTSAGLPTDLFASGEARWLGVQAQGQPEQPRVLLLSVPYALKAADAETLGGKPASAFLQAVQADFPGSPDTDEFWRSEHESSDCRAEHYHRWQHPDVYEQQRGPDQFHHVSVDYGQHRHGYRLTGGQAPCDREYF